MKIIKACSDGSTILEDDDGQLWLQPQDNLPPIPYFVGDTTQYKGLERKPYLAPDLPSPET